MSHNDTVANITGDADGTSPDVAKRVESAIVNRRMLCVVRKQPKYDVSCVGPILLG